MTRHKDIEARNYKFFLSVVAKKTATGSILGNIEKFTGKHMCQSLIFNKVAGLRHRCFPVNFAKFFRASFFPEQLRWLLLLRAFSLEQNKIVYNYLLV